MARENDNHPGQPAVNYDIILADPPWDHETWSDKGKGRSAERYYDTMEIDAICALPVADLAADNAVLFLWVTWPRIFDAQRVIESWGFSYRTLAWEWLKLNRRWQSILAAFAAPLLALSDIRLLEKLFFMGMGHYTRANPEPCLLAVRGRKPVATRSERNVLIAPVREHSRKPDEQYAKIGRLYPEGRRLELFARQRWPGWDAWGNEVESAELPEFNRGVQLPDSDLYK